MGDYETLLLHAGAPEGQRLSRMGPFLAENFTQELCLAGREDVLKPTEEMLKEMQLV